MKTEMYRFNGNLYYATNTITLNFYVEIHCIQSFITELNIHQANSKTKMGYVISKNSDDYIISNKVRRGKHIVLTLPAFSMYNKLLKLGFNSNSEVRDNIYVYQYRFDKTRHGKLTCVLLWKPKRGWYLQRRNFPVTYKSVYANGTHFTAMNGTYAFPT
jgi:hypothetical protein